MKQETQYTVAGTTTLNGQTKVRFANDLVARIKIFTKAGCSAVNLIDLPKPMSKLEALQYLQTQPGFTEGDVGYAVASKLSEKTKVAKKGEVKVAATRVTKKATTKVVAE